MIDLWQIVRIWNKRLCDKPVDFLICLRTMPVIQLDTLISFLRQFHTNSFPVSIDDVAEVRYIVFPLVAFYLFPDFYLS